MIGVTPICLFVIYQIMSFEPTRNPSYYTTSQLIDIVRRWSLEDKENYIKEINKYMNHIIDRIPYDVVGKEFMDITREARWDFVRDLYYQRIRSRGTGHFLHPRNNEVYREDISF